MNLTIQQPPSGAACEDLIRQMESLRQDLTQQAEASRALVLSLPERQRQSAENLLHYLAMRSHDLRTLQRQLAQFGLSSLDGAASAVLPTVDSVLYHLYRLDDRPIPASICDPGRRLAEQEANDLDMNTVNLLGERPAKRRTRIMVTMSSEAADDYLLVHRLVKSGMDCLRINCSHDDPSVWSRTIGFLRDAERATSRSCRILMDMGGPKLRIGPMERLPAVQKIKPKRNALGEVISPARIWLTAEDAHHDREAAKANLKVAKDWLQQAEAGQSIRLVDARGSKRRWRIREVSTAGCWAEAKKTAYLVNGTELVLKGDGEHLKTTVRSLAPVESFVAVRTGDILFVSGEDEPGYAAVHGDNRELLSPGKISLPVDEIYRDAHPGERICFDDGRIVGMIEKIEGRQLQLRITHTRKAMEKLTRDKGVNFPDTCLSVPALRPKDLEDLEFAARHADLIGLSFANCREDVSTLRKHLCEMGHEDVGVVLKIETRRGFANLPEMLFEAMKFPACGVMIARGDLGVECGFERMVELQQEMIGLCEAAQVPVIWATQVLESLAKRGHPTRAEVTDAGMSQAAECVMLNKGPYIADTVAMLDHILRCMQEHEYKNRPLLKPLGVASQFTSSQSART